MRMVDYIECSHTRCHAPVYPQEGSGQPKKYCSDKCRKNAAGMRKRTTLLRQKTTLFSTQGSKDDVIRDLDTMTVRELTEAQFKISRAT